MNPICCEKEQEILKAVQSGQWPDGSDDALRSHAARCPVCADVVQVVQYLQQLEQSARAEVALPEAGRIWWKAQLLEKRWAAERATQPIAMIEKFTCACGAMGFIAIAIWQWPQIHGWLKRFRDLWFHRAFVAPWSHLPNSILMMSLFASLLFIAFLLGLIWAEE